METPNIGVGQTYDIVFVPPSPGKWLLHCCIFSHSETAHGMQGMVTYLDVTGVAPISPYRRCLVRRRFLVSRKCPA